jgi:hypothetical protein
MTVIEKQSGNYLKGDFVKEKGLTQLKITSEPKDVQGDFGIKLECQVSYENFSTGSPSTWTLNKKSRNALIDKLGNDTAKWIGFNVPVETAITEKGRAIYVDIPALTKMNIMA